MQTNRRAFLRAAAGTLVALRLWYATCVTGLIGLVFLGFAVIGHPQMYQLALAGKRRKSQRQAEGSQRNNHDSLRPWAQTRPRQLRRAITSEAASMQRITFALIAVVCLLAESSATAQAPVALPYTMTTIGGSSPMAATAGTQCPNLAAGVVSTDAFGDGCLAVNGIFGVGAYSGLVVDPFGNVLVNDDIKGVLHLINPNSGIMTVVAGGGTACSAKQDSSGDGCVAATGTPTTPIVDPYGNVLLAGYNDHFVHIICRNESPLCGSGAPSAANPIQIPIGNLGLVAGCAYSGGATGVSGTGVDNTPAFTLPTAGFSGSPFVNASGSSSPGPRTGFAEKTTATIRGIP